MPGWIAFRLGFAGISAGLLLVRRMEARAARARGGDPNHPQGG
jgi:hypothetical protein